MSKYSKLINWILGGFITIFFLYGPMLSEQYNCFFLYTSSRILAGLFLIYCLLSSIYWIRNKNLKLVIHYSIIVGLYILLSFMFFIVAAHLG